MSPAVEALSGILFGLLALLACVALFWPDLVDSVGPQLDEERKGQAYSAEDRVTETVADRAGG